MNKKEIDNYLHDAYDRERDDEELGNNGEPLKDSTMDEYYYSEEELKQESISDDFINNLKQEKKEMQRWKAQQGI